MLQPCVVCQQIDVPTMPTHFRHIGKLTIADMLSEFAVFDVRVICAIFFEHFAHAASFLE